MFEVAPNRKGYIFKKYAKRSEKFVESPRRDRRSALGRSAVARSAAELWPPEVVVGVKFLSLG